jgi:hypothetical protein
MAAEKVAFVEQQPPFFNTTQDPFVDDSFTLPSLMMLYRAGNPLLATTSTTSFPWDEQPVSLCKVDSL